jgi:hypothetical protein
MTILSRIFPKQFDNAYRGHWLAIWLLVPIVLGKSAMGINSIINTRMVAMSADGLPLDSYAGGGAEAVVTLFSLWGLSNLLLGLQGVVVLIRYRAMIPFMYLLLLVQQIGGKALVLMHPFARTGVFTAQLGAGFILALLALTLIGFVLSLQNKESAR